MQALCKRRAPTEETMALGKQPGLKSLFSLSQLVLTSGQLGQGVIQKHSRVSYLEVEILDARTKKQICILEKILPSFTIADVKHKFYKICPQWYPSRVGLQLESNGPPLKETKVIKNLATSSIITLYFRDLGTQVNWTTVFLTEYIGPLLIYLLFYFRLPHLYDMEDKNYWSRPLVVQAVPFTGDSPHGWLITSITLSTHLPVCGAGNYFTNAAIIQVHKAGTKNHIVRPTYNPFTWLFKLVSCPNYTYEMGVWISFTVMTQTFPVAVFALMISLQLIMWAQRKHYKYQKDIKNYPSYRTALIPFVL
ncbi:trans-2,3-enoyl-CoA reductase-like isoform X3 [Mobula hypostoma]|uniref:trans-2,3-enoyl-CoA reductase-like isoform X3 n=1 Tax=Mobula hypostoma TaxID=723540 RepID=UPI002FC3848A